MAKLFSLDPGTNTAGYAIFEDKVLKKAGSVSVHKDKDRWKRTRLILSQLFDLGMLEVDTVVSEEPVFRGPAAIAFNRFIGAVEYLRDDPVLYYKPTTVKAAMGHGFYDKDQVAASVIKLLSIEELDVIQNKLNDRDMTDAIAVGLTAMGRHLVLKKENHMATKKTATKKGKTKKNGKSC